MFLMALPGHGWGTQQKHHGWFGFRMLRPGHFLDFKHILSIQLKLEFTTLTHTIQEFDAPLLVTLTDASKRCFRFLLTHTGRGLTVIAYISGFVTPSNTQQSPISDRETTNLSLFFDVFLSLFLGVTITLCHYTFQLRKSVSPGLRLRSEVGLQRWMARLLRGNMGKIWRFPQSWRIPNS